MSTSGDGYLIINTAGKYPRETQEFVHTKHVEIMTLNSISFSQRQIA